MRYTAVIWRPVIGGGWGCHGGRGGAVGQGCRTGGGDGQGLQQPGLVAQQLHGALHASQSHHNPILGPEIWQCVDGETT